MSKKERLVSPTRKKLKNLKQFADMDESEFEEHFQSIAEGSEILIDLEELEKKVEKKLAEFEDDYDLSDMKINDKLVLRNLVLTIISLEDLEQTFAGVQTSISDRNILLLDRLSNVMSRLRTDISKMQNDLKLTRKIRKEGQEETFMAWLDKVKDYGEEFYEEKTLSIFCPTCRRFLSSVWLLYPDGENSVKLKCNNCGEYTIIKDLKELYKTRNRNLEDVALP
jgi:hypothetical protein